MGHHLCKKPLKRVRAFTKRKQYSIIELDSAHEMICNVDKNILHFARCVFYDKFIIGSKKQV